MYICIQATSKHMRALSNILQRFSVGKDENEWILYSFESGKIWINA